MMEPKILKVDPETGDQLIRVNASIQHQSVNLGLAAIKCRELESGLQSMYEYRQNLLGKVVQGAGIDPNAVREIHITPDQQQVTVYMKPAAPAPEAVPAPEPAPGS